MLLCLIHTNVMVGWLAMSPPLQKFSQQTIKMKLLNQLIQDVDETRIGYGSILATLEKIKQILEEE